MDLDEYALTESQRTLKRLGVTHVWRTAEPGPPDSSAPAHEPSGPVAAGLPRNGSAQEGPARAGLTAPAAPATPAPRRAQKPLQTRTQPSSTGGENRREAQLPPILRSLFHGKQSPVRTLWTYAGLYADMQHAVAPPRLDLFRKIQASVRSHLGWQDKDICSWPLDVTPEIFLHGIRSFSPAIVIGFGPDLALPVADGPDAALLKGCALYVLPSLDDMAGGDKQTKNEAWQILQSIRP